MLGRAGVPRRDGKSDQTSWLFHAGMPDGAAWEIRCTGPDLPRTVPSRTVAPADIAKDPGWRGLYRLVVAASLIVLDLCWRPDEPLRIMTFSRGDWEDALIAMAAGSRGVPG